MRLRSLASQDGATPLWPSLTRGARRFPRKAESMGRPSRFASLIKNANGRPEYERQRDELSLTSRFPARSSVRATLGGCWQAADCRRTPSPQSSRRPPGSRIDEPESSLCRWDRKHFAACVAEAAKAGHRSPSSTVARRPPLPEGVASIAGDLGDARYRELGRSGFDVVCQFIAFTPEQIVRDIEMFSGGAAHTSSSPRPRSTRSRPATR